MFFYCHLNVDCRGCRGFGLVIASPILVLSRKRRQAQEASAVMCICHLTLMIAAPCHSTLSPLFRTRVASKLFPDVFGCSVLERSCLRMQFSLSENSGCYLICCCLFSKGSRTCEKQSGYKFIAVFHWFSRQVRWSILLVQVELHIQSTLECPGFTATVVDIYPVELRLQCQLRSSLTRPLFGSLSSCATERREFVWRSLERTMNHLGYFSGDQWNNQRIMFCMVLSGIWQSFLRGMCVRFHLLGQKRSAESDHRLIQPTSDFQRFQFWSCGQIDCSSCHLPFQFIGCCQQSCVCQHEVKPCFVVCPLCFAFDMCSSCDQSEDIDLVCAVSCKSSMLRWHHVLWYPHCVLLWKGWLYANGSTFRWMGVPMRWVGFTRAGLT